MSGQFTVSDYLLVRLKEIGVDHAFGVPGDFVLGFLNHLLRSEVTWVGTCNELNAAYAADGYARIRGIGAVVTTFGVGELSAVNGIAGAFAERIPVVMVVGSPATAHFANRPLLHHTLGDYQIPLRIFEKITVAACQLASPLSAPAEIDRVLTACLVHQRPVYVSLPADIAQQECARPAPFVFPLAKPSHGAALREAVLAAVGVLALAQRPLVIAGVELVRGRMQSEFAAFLAATGFDYVTMMMGKTVLSERHPRYLGLFEGDRSCEAVRREVAESDCVLELGAWLTDFSTGGFTTHLTDARTISAGRHAVRVHQAQYQEVGLRDFMAGLAAELQPRGRPVRTPGHAPEALLTSPGTATTPLTVQRFFDRAGQFLADGVIVLAETGVSLFSAAELPMPDGATFIGQTFYGSIGYTLGATLGAATAARERRVVLFIGDGAFQVTCQELSTLIRQHLKPIIFLLNNDGYTIERVICDHSYNDLQPWKYHALVDAFGGGLAFDVRTEGELEVALERAAEADVLVLIEVHTDRLDCTPALRSAGQAMAATNDLT